MKMPSVITSMRVAAETFEPNRTRRPTVRPTSSPNVDAMRAAAARAASRRGSKIRILRPSSHGSSSSASGTRVVLPAPGGATSTMALRARSAAAMSGSTASMGRDVGNGCMRLTRAGGPRFRRRSRASPRPPRDRCCAGRPAPAAPSPPSIARSRALGTVPIR